MTLDYLTQDFARDAEKDLERAERSNSAPRSKLRGMQGAVAGLAEIEKI